MKNDILGVLIISSFLLFAIEITHGEGTTGAQFLGIGVGARACGMGEAYGAIADDPSAIYWNPAGLSQIKSRELILCQNFWFLDMSHQYLAGVFSNSIGYFGVSFYYSSSGDIPRIENFLKVGKYSAYDAALSLAYANEVGKFLSFGVAGKYILEKIEDESASSFALDLGLLYKSLRLPGLRLALALQNMGPKIKFIEEGDRLPLNLKIAAAYLRGDFSFASELDKTIDSDPLFGLGGEYVILRTLALRAGYNTGNSFSLGLGISWRNFALGYAFVPYEDLDSSNRISLRLRF